MTSPVPPAAPEGVPVTLWRGDAYESHGFYPCESAFQRRDEWKALPVAAYDALLSRLAAAEAERDGARAAMKCDDDRLRAASEKVGRPPMGCDTADDLADAILGLRKERDEARKSYIALSDYFKTALADRDEARALLWECRDLFLNGPAFVELRGRVDTALGAERGRG